MTRRDIGWRCAGVALFGIATGQLLTNKPDGAGVSGLISFAIALFAIVLVFQGKRVPLLFKIERSRHRTLPSAIHARRRRPQPADRDIHQS